MITPNVDEDAKKLGHSYIAGRNIYVFTLENSLVLSSQAKYKLIYDPAIALLSFNPRERKTYIHTKTYSQSFIAALFLIPINRKQLTCPSTDESLNKLVYPFHDLSNK